jgi:hypothetical protein
MTLLQILLPNLLKHPKVCTRYAETLDEGYPNPVMLPVYVESRSGQNGPKTAWTNLQGPMKLQLINTEKDRRSRLKGGKK